jgi:hypothetical protein
MGVAANGHRVSFETEGNVHKLRICANYISIMCY